MIGLLFAGTWGLAYFVFAPTEGQRVVAQRVRELRRGYASWRKVEDEELARPFAERVLDPLLEKVYRWVYMVTPHGVRQRAEARLLQAGRPMDATRFVGLKATLAMVAALFFLAAPWASETRAEGRTLLTGAVAVALVFSLPEVWLSRLVTRRKSALEKSLPDVLDLLCVSVEAGLGLDGAIQKVSDKFTGPTAEEFREYLKEVRLGSTRAEGLRRLAQRTGLPEFKSFTAALIQADELGVSISKVLRVQSEQMRQRRRQQAEERAMKTPIKMLFPLIFFIFPTLFIVLLGPAVVEFVGMFGR